MVALAVWGLALEPGKKYSVQSKFDIQLTGATYGEKVQGSARTLVKVHSILYPEDDEEDKSDEDEEDEDEEKEQSLKMQEVILCALVPGKIEYQTLTMILPTADDMIELEVTGTNIVHLSGNYIDQHPPDHDHDDMSDMEDDYDLSEVPSDVDLDSDEYAAALNGQLDEDSDEIDDDLIDGPRITEITDSVPSKSSKKRAREDDDEGDESKADVSMNTDGAPKLSKAEKKKLKKKQKAENGEAVAPPAVAPATNGKAPSPDKEPKEGKKEKKAKDKEKRPAENGEDKDKAKKSKKITLPSGVILEDKKIGTGPQAKAGKTIKVRYIGKLANGQIFDKNTGPGKPFSFVMGKGGVIKGWDEGLAGMAVGGERKLTVPPSAAYGSKKTGNIPANATLSFEIKMIGID